MPGADVPAPDIQLADSPPLDLQPAAIHDLDLVDLEAQANDAGTAHRWVKAVERDPAGGFGETVALKDRDPEPLFECPLLSRGKVRRGGADELQRERAIPGRLEGRPVQDGDVAGDELDELDGALTHVVPEHARIEDPSHRHRAARA